MKGISIDKKSDSITYKNIKELAEIINSLNQNFVDQITNSADFICNSLKSGGTIFLCGNGGSAADCQHFSSELIGKFNKERIPLRAISLTTDTSVLTNISNDFSYDLIFSRQLKALAREGDVLISISTSGESSNVINAIYKAKELKLKTVSILGKDGGRALKISDNYILVPSYSTARIQEIHALTEHIICELIEEKLGLK